MGFIYKLTLKKESRKAYIGQTIRDIHKRLEEHQLESSGCKAISGAIQKHGWENFDKEWYEVPDEDLNFYEEMLVALLGTLAPGGYNLMEGGGNKGRPSEETKQKMSEAHIGKTLSEESKQKNREAHTGEKNHMYGKEHTEETKKKMSEAQSGRILSDKTKQKMSEAQTGKMLSEKTKQKMSEAISGEKNHFYGKTHTEEAKQKNREAHLGKHHTEEAKQKNREANQGENNTTSKKVYQYDIDGNFIWSFASCGEAARHLKKKDGSAISRCARGNIDIAYGFKWSYTEL